MEKFKKYLKLLAILLLVLIIAAAIGFKIYTSRYYKADMDTIIALESELEPYVNSYSDDQGMVFIPENQEIKAIIAFYPGGKVEYTAYGGFMYELASRGYLCLLPEMPENLAFLGISAVDSIKKRYPDKISMVENLDWYLAGHSLGGVAATVYLSENLDDYAGVILCASYPTKDFSDEDIGLLSVYGSLDKVLNMDNYEYSKAYWSEDATEYVIEGGIHSYFGCYGIQNGDGTPEITNREQIKEAADVIENWIDQR